MKLANPLQPETMIQKGTAGSSSKRTWVRKRVDIAKSSAFSALLDFPLTRKFEHTVTGTNLGELITARWKDVSNSAINYRSFVVMEFDNALQEVIIVESDLTYNFLSFLTELTQNVEIPHSQKTFAKRIVKRLSEVRIAERVIFKYSAENEILLIKSNEKGNHYLIIGEDENDLSYGLVGNRIGEYKTSHFGGDITLNNLVSEFANG